jgi:glycosyltransferase involved in cell wall biosynthesis
MRILFFSDNFPPETNAPAVRTHQHAREWAALGHDVTVVTCAPNFPTGRIHEGYRNRRSVERVDGMRVVRVWSYIAANRGRARRSLDFLSFAVSAVPAGVALERPDVVVGTSPQLFTVLAAWFVARLKRAPCVFELRDLWPESVQAVGAAGSGAFLGVIGALADFLYRHVDHIVSVTESFSTILQERGIPADRISVVRNGVDVQEFDPGGVDGSFREDIGVGGDEMLVTYLGTVGMAHALETVLDAAELLRGGPTRFLVVGEGAEKEALVEEASRRGLLSVTFMDGQPRERVPSILAASDAVLVHLRDDPLFSHVIPSKIFEAMAMARPIILGVRGESARIVDDAGAGLLVEPGNARDLADAVERLRLDPELRRELGRNGRVAAERDCSRKEAAAKMLGVLSDVAARR